MPPTVSVIIPTYNRGYCVKEAIESVLSQTFQDFELIVVDDGSNDNTAEIISSYGERVKYVLQENAGVSEARNRGIREAQGKWLAFLDSDDLWVPEKLKIQIECVKRYTRAIAQMVDSLIELPSGEYISTFKLRRLWRSFFDQPFRERPLLDVLKAQYFTSSWLIKKEIAEAAGNFNARKRIYEDIDFLTRVALEGPFVNDCHECVLIKRRNKKELTLSDINRLNKKESLGNMVSMYINLKNDSRLNRIERRYVCRQLSGARHELALEYRYEKNLKEYFRLLVLSVLDEPGIRSATKTALSLIGLYSKVVRKKKLRKCSVRRSDLLYYPKDKLEADKY